MQLVEAKSLVKHILEQVNEAVRERENLRRAADMNRRLDRRLLEMTNDPLLAEFKVSSCPVTFVIFIVISLRCSSIIITCNIISVQLPTRKKIARF